MNKHDCGALVSWLFSLGFFEMGWWALSSWYKWGLASEI